MSSLLVPTLEKSATGILGFDQVTRGGIPHGRPTLVAGQAGAGKTLFAFEFVLNGVAKYGEPGVFASFEETPEELIANLGGMDFDVHAHLERNKLRILHIEVDPEEMIEAGDYDLDGLFLRLNGAIDAVGAKRVALDAVENLFGAFTNMRRLRAAFRRLLDWFKSRGITTVITTERGVETLTRHGIEEYLADCVVSLDNRIESEIATRRLRVVKYRGSSHESDEFPFVVGQSGLSVFPATSAGMHHAVSSERVTLGIPDLDGMLGGGVYRGSTVLVSGTSGTGKSSIAAYAADAACRRGESCLYVALEESPDQIERNMASIGLDLASWRRAGRLSYLAARVTEVGLEGHLARIVERLDALRPDLVVVDPITGYSNVQRTGNSKPMLIRATDLLKARGITSIYTALTYADEAEQSTASAISSIVDTWLLLRNLELAGERTRGLYVCKARGIAHSNQIREFVLTNDGVRLVDVTLDPSGQVLTGSARDLQVRREEELVRHREADALRRRGQIASRARVMEARIAAMRAESEDELKALEADLQIDGSNVAHSGRSMFDLAARRTSNGHDGPKEGSSR